MRRIPGPLQKFACRWTGAAAVPSFEAMIMSRLVGRISRVTIRTLCTALAVVTVTAVTACRRPTASTAPRPARKAGVPAGLPAVPAISGAPLVVRVQYPSENQLIASRDSNFLLGSLGSGDATLRINGVPVAVAPNGAFLAFVANPPVNTPSYALVAVRGTDTVRAQRTVRLPAPPPPSAVRLNIDVSSALPARGSWVRADEMIRVSAHAPSNALLHVIGRDGIARTMQNMGPPAGASLVPFAVDVAARLLSDDSTEGGTTPRFVATRGRDSAVVNAPLVRVLDSNTRLVGILRIPNVVDGDTDRVVNARTIVNGTYKWQLLQGTSLEVTGRLGGFTRVRLDNTLEVWVDDADITVSSQPAALPRRITGGFRVTPSAEYVDVTIGIGQRPAHYVESDARSLSLTLYGTQANPEISRIIGNDTLIRRIAWEQVTSDRVRITLSLSQQVYGWQVLFDDRRDAFVLRVRRAPHIDAERPLSGLVIAVDAGHPPAGSTGPTGLYEGDAVLPVAAFVAQLLRARGATPVLTRTSLAPLGLAERSVIARRANVHAFVSIHLNALPDGVNPFTNNGTSTLFFHQQSEPLARPVQEEMVARFGLRDLGVHYQNLAIARPTWYPSVLTEGLFILLPEQESAMRDAAFQARYAEAIVVGLERYFRALNQ